MKRNIIYTIIFLILIIIAIYSTSNIIVLLVDNYHASKELEQIRNISQVVKIINLTDLEEETSEATLINVNFQELKSINTDVAGWIQVEGTDINLPYVQGEDNDFYLSHAFTKAKNKTGWLFLDYRNNKDNYEKNTIIYGHNLISGGMFGTLKNVLTKEWFNDENNHYVKISTENKNYLYEVFSVYTIDNTSDYLKVLFESDDEFINFGNMLINRSNFNFNTSINIEDKILTLSTCYKTDERLVLHAKLIKEI